MSLTVSSSSMELLHVYYCLPLFLAVSPSALALSLIVDGCLSLSLRSHGVASCLSQSLIVAGLSLLVPWRCCMSLTLSKCCLLSLTVFPCPMELLHVSNFLLWFLSLSLPVLWSCCISLTLSYSRLLSLTVYSVQGNCYISITISSSFMQFLRVSYRLFFLLAVSHYFCSPME